MNKVGVWAAMTLLLMLSTGGAANAQDTSFVLANNTQFTVYAVYIWPADSRYPGPDRLGNTTMESGAAYQFAPDDDTCRYNIRVVLEGANHANQWDDVNLCNLRTFTLNYDYMDQNLSASRQ